MKMKKINKIYERKKNEAKNKRQPGGAKKQLWNEYMKKHAWSFNITSAYFGEFITERYT